MKVVIFGLGSIGLRHLRLLKDEYDLDLYAFRTRLGQENVDSGINEISGWNEIEQIHPDVAFITNPSYLHIETATECAKRGMHLFIEKPLDIKLEGLGELLGLVREKNLTSYVAYTMRFHPVVQALKAATQNLKPLHARITCTSFFPNWRPNQNHLKSYTAQQDKSGGVVFELSHELDFAVHLFGPVKELHGVRGKFGSVTVDSDDAADIIAVHAVCNSNIHVNLFSRKLQRFIEIDCEDASFHADIIRSELYITDASGATRIDRFPYERDDLFRNQLAYFFDNIGNPRMNNNIFEASELLEKMVTFSKNAT